MIALITGITGQDGSYLAEFLLSKGYTVHGIIRRSSSINLWRLTNILNKVTLHYGDMTDMSSLDKIIRNVNPTEIYNLAAMSHVRVSFDIPDYTTSVIANGIVNLLEVVRNSNPKIKIYQAGTSEMFGNPTTSSSSSKNFIVPLNETSKFNPKSPYAISKVFAHQMCQLYRQSYNMFICNGILFNHTSPRRGHDFVEKKIVDGAKAIIAGKQDKLSLGNLYSVRDIGHSKDYVVSMWLMLQQDKADDYVISTGITYSVKRIVEIVFKKLGMNLVWSGSGLDEVGMVDGIVRVVVDQRYFRPVDVNYLVGDPTKADDKLGWSSSISFEEIIDEMIKIC